MEQKWNLQDIKPAAPRKKRMPSRVHPRKKVQTISKNNDDGTMHVSIENGNTKKRSHLFMAVTLFLFIVGAGFGASFLLSGAEVTVYPRNKEPNINAVFTTFRTPQVQELSYEIMTLEADGERQVSATGQEEVTEQATGMLTIHKKTAGAERLIKNTRFESTDGLIYRIAESVVVPGAVENTSGEIISGTIQAKVFADQAGEEYNIESDTFTIPGFKEGGYTDLFNALYAENPEPMTGGFKGVKFIIDDTELETAKQVLQTELRDALLARVAEEKPSGFVVFDSAITFTYQSLPAVEYGDNLATIKEKALLQVPLFKDETFAEFLATAAIPGYEQEPVRIADTGALTFSYSSATTTHTDIGNKDSLEFKLTGKPHIIWTYDSERLKADLLNSPKTAITSILGAYPAIERAEAVIKPFWKQTFPTTLAEITIIESLGDSAVE